MATRDHKKPTRELLTCFGENPTREGLLKTPEIILLLPDKLLSESHQSSGSVFSIGKGGAI
jgi:GTP cyclohydrolase I